MFASRTITFASFPPLSPIRLLLLRISSNFSPSNRMGKIVNSSTDSSPAEPLPAVANSVFPKDPIMADLPSADTSHNDKASILIGSITVFLDKKPVKNCSFPSSHESTSSAVQPDATSVSEHNKSKRKSQVDLGLTQASGYNCSLSDYKTLSTTNFTSHHDESPQGSCLRKKKAAFVNKPYDIHCNPYYAAPGPKLDSQVSLSKFKPFDICFPGKRNYAFIGATVPVENKESCIEMHEGGIKEGILRSGMVLLKHFISHDEQVEIVKICRELGMGPGGFYQPGYADGAKLRLRMMCLGMDWDPQTRKYGKKRIIDGSMPPSIPDHFSELVIRAIQEAHQLINKEYRESNVESILPSMTPDICIANFYTTNGRLGLHQDRDESRQSLRKGLPVVSFSVGDSAEFLYGDQRDVEKAEKVLLESGDVLIFGGESRHVFHGVSSVLPNSAPMQLLKDTHLCPGRLNLTFRQY